MLIKPLVSYQKAPLSFSQQVSHLAGKGMIFYDKSAAERTLACISYYRLSGYWYPFRVRDSQNTVTDQFQANTHFSDVVSLYEFDRQLRTLVLDAIERVEVAVRTQFTYHMGHRYGAFAHTDQQNFHPSFGHAKWLAKLDEETKRSRDDFIRHYRDKYAGFPAIPIWMLTEVMSLGALSFGYNGLQNNQKQGVEDKKAIAEYFNLHYKSLGDWLHTLTYIRNLCAHHNRLWNRALAIKPDRGKNKAWMPPLTPRNDRVFYVLLMLRHLLKATDNGTYWQASINQLLAQVEPQKRWRAAMGLPENWREHPLWK
jgi:abortive infection bacteriophage resistance protein